MGTRGNRQFDIVIVDEVDSMFIDGSNHSTRLIDKMPQMDYIEPIFAAIWYALSNKRWSNEDRHILRRHILTGVTCFHSKENVKMVAFVGPPYRTNY